MSRIDYRLAVLQILTIVAASIAVIALILLFHHQTDDYAVPFLQYLGSIRIAIPPILVLFTSYFVAFISGVNLADAPRLVLRYLRNRFFQSWPAMMAMTLGLLAVSILILWYTSAVAPPSYSRLVALLLGGEQDRQVLVSAELKMLEQKNPELGHRFQLVADVFLERSQRNFTHKTPNTTTPRIFVRALDANVDSADWQNHPLRKLALAEAYSMWAQAALSSPLRRASDDNWREWLRKCLELNDQVAHSDSPLATPLMRYSALNNSGNALLYTEDPSGAVQFYEKVLAEQPNLSSSSNLVAAYILLADLDKAIVVGNQAREWALQTGKGLTETSALSGALGNTAVAYLMRSEYRQATELFTEAYDLESDNLNALNLALSLLLDGEADAARYVLAQFKYPDLELAEQQQRVRDDYDHCYYLIGGLAVERSDYPQVAAHLYTYLGRARTVAQLTAEDAASNHLLRWTVLDALKVDRTPCGDLARVPGVRALLDGK